MNVLVTGASGFLGRHLMPILRRSYGSGVTGVSRKDYDLTDPQAVRQMLEIHHPDVVIHLAAYVGGIGANRSRPADFFFRNTILTTLMFDAASRFGVKKLVYPMGGCSYPAKAVSPIDETQMWNGYPQQESAAYSVAKKTGLVASDAYRRQHGLHSVVIIPGNLYGEYDNFDLQESHVIPGMIRRFFEAKLNRQEKITLWGSGTPVRDFVYAEDVARTIPFFIDQYDSPEPVNLSSGVATPIKELAETVADLVGFPGKLEWDTSKPDGQMVKVFDTSRMKSLGLSCPTSLGDGLKKTIAWFEANYQTQGDGIRLSEAAVA